MRTDTVFTGALMMGTLALTFTNMAEESIVLDPEEAQKVAIALDDDAQLMSNTQLEVVLVGQPPDVQAEILRINEEARPIALQVALLVPLIAAVLGLLAAQRMMREKDIEPSADLEGMAGFG